MRHKTADFEKGTKLPIFKTDQNRRLRKRDKTADYKNETKSPIAKTRQNRRFFKILISSFVSVFAEMKVPEKKSVLV